MKEQIDAAIAAGDVVEIKRINHHRLTKRFYGVDVAGVIYRLPVDSLVTRKSDWSFGTIAFVLITYPLLLAYCVVSAIFDPTVIIRGTTYILHK